MDDFERRVMGEIGRLEGPEFPRGRRAARQRVETIRALAEAAVAGRPWTGPEGVLGPKRPATVVSENNFYERAHWYQHPLVREVIEAVTELYGQRDAAEKERARQDNRVWVEQKELEAAAAGHWAAGQVPFAAGQGDGVAGDPAGGGGWGRVVGHFYSLQKRFTVGHVTRRGDEVKAQFNVI